nr:MAG: replication associated protein [Cressdnaviricota sp.]
MTSRNWCFTINNEPLLANWPEFIKYGIYQRERGQSGTDHLQGYMEFNSAVRITHLTKWNSRGHYEVRKGSRDQARDYCKKEQGRVSGPYEIGTFGKGQGERGDLDEIYHAIEGGKGELELAREYPGSWTRYNRSFNRYRSLIEEPRSWKTMVYVITGAPGTGKSKYCMDNAPGGYWKDNGQWWDGYHGQHDVIIDDFYGWLPWNVLLRLCDRYPMQVETKGGTTTFLAKRIFITSNKEYTEWYREDKCDIAALARRIDQILTLTPLTQWLSPL